MAEELRIVVTDSGGAGGGGGGARVPGVTGGGVVSSRAPSVAAGVPGSVISGIAAGVGIGAFNLASSVAYRTAALPARGIRALNAQVSDLSGLSAPLAQAVAESQLSTFDVRRRRAATIGGALAGFERTRSAISDRLGELTTEILKVMLAFFDAVKPLIEKIASGIESLVELLRTELPNFLEGFADSLPDFIYGPFKEPLRVMARALRSMEKAAEEADLANFFDQLMSNLALPVGFWPDDQEAPAAQRAPRRRQRRF